MFFKDLNEGDTFVFNGAQYTKRVSRELRPDGRILFFNAERTLGEERIYVLSHEEVDRS